MDTGQPSIAPVLSPQPWYQVWMDAITKPNVEAYEALVSRPGVSMGRAILWVFASSLLGSAIALVMMFVFRGFDPLSSQTAPSGDPGSYLVSLACLAPVAAVVSVLGLMLIAGISHMVARALGGSGTYPQLVYATAAYSSPITLVSSVISSFPVVSCLGLPIALYAIFLNILAVKAVHRISWGRAVVSSTAVIAGLLALFACVVIVLLALLGPAIGEVFSSVITELGTPSP
ncbi:MAG TPA: Yip1 family protein [Anaerolineales bacterium]|nr:Yip1 family protein [Anaerolineales bacterium]